MALSTASSSFTACLSSSFYHAMLGRRRRQAGTESSVCLFLPVLDYFSFSMRRIHIRDMPAAAVQCRDLMIEIVRQVCRMKSLWGGAKAAQRGGGRFCNR